MTPIPPTNGKRFDCIAQFISRRRLDCDGTPVHRLVFEVDSGAQIDVLVTPDREPLHDLGTGREYHFEGLLGAAPDSSDAEGRITGGDVPHSLDSLDTPSKDVLSTAVASLELHDELAIADGETTIRWLRDDDE